jgi:hypothetical protein
MEGHGMPNTLTRLAIAESRPFIEAVTAAEGDSRFLITLITPGQGSSGYYPQATLEAAGRDGVFPAGLHMYVNHQTSTEWQERPEGDINGLAAVLVEAAYWDPERKALVAEAKVFRHWADRLKDLVEAIGVSIRAFCDAEVQDIDGTPRNVVTRIVEAISTDFVTHAGRGGLYEVLESARRAPVNAATRRGMAEATANTRRAELSELVRDEYADEKTWTWIRDFDDATVWYEVETADEAAIWQQTYSVENDRATALTGEQVEVRVEVRYVPVTATNSTEAAPVDTPAAEAAPDVPEAAPGPDVATPAPPVTEAAPHAPVDPAGPPETPAPETQEVTMPQIEESRLRTLEAAESRVPALEQENAQLQTATENAERRAAMAEAREYARTYAGTRIREANADLSTTIVNRIVESTTGTGVDIPLTPELRLDTAVLGESVDAERAHEEQYLAELLEESGLGSVRGVGPLPGSVTAPTPAEEAEMSAIFGVKG